MKTNPEWTAYNQIHNEGGEGYNPHPQYIEGRGEPEWSKLAGRIARVERIMDATSASSPRYAELESELAVLRAAAKIARAENI